MLVKRRSPQGERGLKFSTGNICDAELLSLPARGARIEIRNCLHHASDKVRRSPQGERGLKSGGPARPGASRLVAPRKGSAD